jgi:cytochrome c oxidase subunit III
VSDVLAGGRRIADVPRSTKAIDADAVVRAAASRTARPAAFWGWLVLIASESTLFGCLIGTYFYLRFQTLHWPPDGIPRPDVAIPLILVCVLALSSVPMQLASLAGRAGRLARARLFLVVALVIQAGYFAYEVHDFQTQLGRFPVTKDAYSSIHYTLLGADHAHVLVGLLFDVWLLWKLARGLTAYRLNALQGITWYWHAVNLLSLMVIGTILSAAV